MVGVDEITVKNKPKTLILYKADRHNYGVVRYEFIFSRTVQDDNGACDIYYADDPYGEEKRITTSLQRHELNGFYLDPNLVHNQCVKYQREEIEILNRKLKNAQELLNKLENGFQSYTPKKA